MNGKRMAMVAIGLTGYVVVGISTNWVCALGLLLCIWSHSLEHH